MGMKMTHDSQATEKAVSTAGFARRAELIRSAIGQFIALRFSGKIRSGTENALWIEEKLSLGPKKVLYLVGCREKEFLVATGPDAIVSVLEVFSEKPAPATARKKASVSQMREREQLP